MNDDGDCAGYELMADLDFDTDADGDVDADDDYPNWAPIGGDYNATFHGNNRAISNMTMTGGGERGLFHGLGGGSRVSNLGLVDVAVTSTSGPSAAYRGVGALAGRSDGIIGGGLRPRRHGVGVQRRRPRRPGGRPRGVPLQRRHPRLLLDGGRFGRRGTLAHRRRPGGANDSPHRRQLRGRESACRRPQRHGGSRRARRGGGVQLLGLHELLRARARVLVRVRPSGRPIGPKIPIRHCPGLHLGLADDGAGRRRPDHQRPAGADLGDRHLRPGGTATTRTTTARWTPTTRPGTSAAPGTIRR